MLSSPLVTMKNVETFYGPIQALRGISLEVARSEIVCIIGANGAGKSTILKTISGALDCDKGDIHLGSMPINGLYPDKVSRLGIAHVPEGREVFPMLSCKENLLIGGFYCSDRKTRLDLVLNYFPALRPKLKTAAGLLSGGQQQMLALGRALMQNPHIILLDEPSLGLAPVLAEEIFASLQAMSRDLKMTLLIVEQNARLALDIAKRGYVLELGRIVLEGTSQQLQQDSNIHEFYLGGRNEGVRGVRRWKKRKSWS